MTALSRATLTDQVAGAILEMIFEHGMSIGDSLPSTTELAKRFDVSVVVVREALANLAGKGILLRRQGKESTIDAPDEGLVSSILSFRVNQELLTLDESLQARAALEVQAVGLASTAGDEASRRTVLLPALEKLAEAEEDKDFIKADLELHLALTELSGNRASVLILRSFYSLIAAEVERRASDQGADYRERSYRIHKEIVDAVIEGDRAMAVKLIERHFIEGDTSVDFGWS